MIGFLIAGFGTSNMVALIFGAAASSVGYLGFLVGPPVVGSVSGMLGLRMALALVVIAGVIIAVSAREVMAEAGS